MPKLSVRRLPLRFEIEQSHKVKIHEMRRKAKYDVALTLGLPIEHRLVNLVYDASQKRVKILLTNDDELLKYRQMLNNKFHIEVRECN